MSKLCIVIGSLEDEDCIKRIVRSVVAGIGMWLNPFPLDDQEEICQFLNGIPSMKSIPNRNAEDDTVVTRFRGRVLDATIIINPSFENLSSELIGALLSPSSKFMIAFGGFVTEEKGDWILQDGLFSYINIQYILKDYRISPRHDKITISCCKSALWKSGGMSASEKDHKIQVEVLDQMSDEKDGQSDVFQRNNIDDFVSFLEEGITNEVGGIFETLKPPIQEGFLKIRNPCVYIFPAGQGDSSLFAVNGFSMLIDGGSTSKPWFWRMIQHLDRVDSVVATHIGSDNLPGLNSLLLRKLQEKQVKLPMESNSEEYRGLARYLVSPDVGPFFMNMPTKFFEKITQNPSPGKDASKLDSKHTRSVDDNSPDLSIIKTTDIVKDTVRLSKALNIELKPLVRKPGNNDPITLFSKVGLGHLDMYVLNPVEGSKEFNYMNEKWGCDGKTSSPSGKTGLLDSDGNDATSPLDNLSSISFLLVWHPTDPTEKIVRALYPGNTSQTKLLEGLEGIKDLPFMKMRHATANSVKKYKQSTKTNDASSSLKHGRVGSASTRKPSSTVCKKPSSASSISTGSSVKKESRAAVSKVADKRLKTEKPSATKARGTTSTVSKAGPVKGNAVKSSKTSMVPPKTSHGTFKVPAQKSDGKAVGSPSAKGVSSKPMKPGTPSKVSEKGKKTSFTAKSRTDTTKPLPKASPAGGPKKSGPTKPASGKQQKSKTPVSAATHAAAPPDHLKADFSKFESEEEPAAKPVELPSASSEEPTISLLSDRHSPEGEDGSTIQHTESTSIAANKKGDVETKTLSDNLEKNDGQNDGQEDSAKVDQQTIKVPEISEDSDMISANGSLALLSKQTPSEEANVDASLAKLEEQFLSSDKSTPDDQAYDKTGKAICFEEPHEARTHKTIERLPTPYHSVLESRSESSPLSDSEAGVPAIGQMKGEDPSKALVEESSELHYEDACEKSFDMIPQKDQDTCKTETVTSATSASIYTGYVQSDVTKDFGSEQYSSFTSSIEGSYELCPTGKSPPPSAQETIAETISEFKQDEPPVIADLQDDQSACFDAHPPQVDLDDQTVSTDLADPGISIGAVSATSQPARMDPPFSSSDTSFSSKGSQLLMQQDNAFEAMPKFLMGSHRTEDDISSLCGSSTVMVSSAREEIQSHGNPKFFQTFIDADVICEKEIENQQKAAETEQEVAQKPIDSGLDQECIQQEKDKDEFDIQKESAKGDSAKEYVDIEHQACEKHGSGDVDDEPCEGIGEEVQQDISLESYYTTQGNEAALKEATWQEEDMQQDEPEEFEPADDEQDAAPDYHQVMNEVNQPIAQVEETESDPLHDDNNVVPSEALIDNQTLGEKCEEGLHAAVENNEDAENRESDSDQEEQAQPTGHVEPVDDLHKDFDLHATQIPIMKNEMQRPESKTPEDEEKLDSKTPEDGERLDSKTPEDEERLDSKTPEDEERLDSKTPEDEERLESKTPEDEAYNEPDEVDDAGQQQSDEIRVPEYLEFEEGKDDLTGSRSSSAQDQGLDETESAPESEIDPARATCEDDGPNLEEYGQVESGILTKSDLSLSSREGSFPLHGAIDASHEQVMHTAEIQGENEFYQPLTQSSPSDLKPVIPTLPLGDEASAGQKRYFPAYIDPSAPLANTEEVHTGIDHLKTADLDSPLDVNAKPFIPKCNFPPDLAQGDGSHEMGFGTAALPPQSTTNPFLMDLMAGSRPVEFDPEENVMPPTRGPDACAAQDKNTKGAIKKTAPGRKPALSGSSPVYVDLAYIPNHGNKNSVGFEFFKRIRAKYLVLSGCNYSRDEPSISVLDHFLHGWKSWVAEAGAAEEANITVIPTHETPDLRDWYVQNCKELELYNIHMVASGSKVLMQGECIEACKILF